LAGFVVASAAIPATAGAAAGHSPARQSHHAPTSHHFKGLPTVGALFMPGLYPTLHTCTASVVRSSSRNVIMTAAHCVSGTGKGYVFVPDYRDGRSPYGVWHVKSAFGDKKWINQTKKSTQRDWAFLRIASHTKHGRTIRLQDEVGANKLGHTATAGIAVHIPAYPLGSERPINCKAKVYLHHRYPAFDCSGYTGGTSGSPWLRGEHQVRTIRGVIGGLHQGGCTAGTSYSSRLGKPARTALKHAEHNHHAQTFPTPPGDGC
jgi:V8-like Glu-specific endopeptidase